MSHYARLPRWAKISSPFPKPFPRVGVGCLRRLALRLIAPVRKAAGVHVMRHPQSSFAPGKRWTFRLALLVGLAGGASLLALKSHSAEKKPFRPGRVPDTRPIAPPAPRSALLTT